MEIYEKQTLVDDCMFINELYIWAIMYEDNEPDVSQEGEIDP